MFEILVWIYYYEVFLVFFVDVNWYLLYGFLVIYGNSYEIDFGFFLLVGVEVVDGIQFVFVRCILCSLEGNDNWFFQFEVGYVY